MCATWLTSFTILLLINVEIRSIDELIVLSYFFLQDFLSMFVCQICHGRTYSGAGCGDLASWVSSWESVYLLPLVWS